MDQVTDGAAGAGEQAPIAVVTAQGDGDLSVIAAARALAQARHKPKDETQASEQRPEAAAAEPAQESTSQEGDAAVETPPGEADSVDPAAQELPPIEPPRSWTKEDKELFAGLPRETQERLAERERSRDTDFSRRQNDAAEKLKGLTAKEQAAEQARQHYESALPQLLQTLQQQHAGEFADVRTIQDVERLAREDWPRYLQWDLAQKKVVGVQQEMQAAQLRQNQEMLQRFAAFAKRQDDLFIEKAPELADAKKMVELQKSAVDTLKAIGFDETELGPAWVGQKDLSLRDHRVQLLIRDASLWRDAQAKAKAATTKSVPPVQRPGTSQPRGAAQDQQIQNLNKQLESASGVNALRAAAKLVAAKRAAAR
jgi:hypothetical protein